MTIFKFVWVLSLALLSSCGDLGSVRALKGIRGIEKLEPKDLSRLTPEMVIKTKYKSLNFSCEGVIEVELIKDGAISSEKKETKILWNITKNTVFLKTLDIQDKILNLSFNFKNVLELKLDEKFNTQITGAPGYEIKTLAQDGTTKTSINSDGVKNQFSLNENESVKVIDLIIDSNENKTSNKLNMTCMLVSDVFLEYR